MLNWSQLSTMQRLISLVFLSFVCMSLYSVLFAQQAHTRVPQLGIPLLMLGCLLHPRFFAGGRGAFSWHSAPMVVRVLWIVGAVVGAISAAQSWFLALTS